MAEREGRTNNPFMKFGRDLLAADKRASREKGKDKDGKYGPRPSELLAASTVMMLLGIGLERISEKLLPATLVAAEKKLSLDANTLTSMVPAWANEAVTDAGAAIAYAIVQKQLGEQLPKLTPQDLFTLVVDVGAYGGDKVVGKTVDSVKNIFKKKEAEKATTDIKLLRNVTNWLNPVTAGAIREGFSAGSDLWSAYRDVVTGAPEKVEEKKESTLTKETTMIYIVPDMASASAMVNTATRETVATS